jgi:hypothetical protein
VTVEEEARVQKKVPDNICARCRKPLIIGHRVQMAFAVCNPNAHNPENITQRGLELGTDCEFVHADCRDPFLDAKLVGQFG